MKKYVYGVILAATLTACAIFFLNPPKVSDHPLPAVISITFQFPEGYEFTEGAPFTLTWQAESPDGSLSAPVPEKHFNPLLSPYNLVVRTSGSRAVVLNAHLYYCHKESRMCFQDDFKTRIPLESSNISTVPFVWEIPAKKD